MDEELVYFLLYNIYIYVGVGIVFVESGAEGFFGGN